MQSYTKFLIACITIILISSCKKEGIELPSSSSVMEEGLIIQKLFLRSTGEVYACGGKRNSAGAVWRSFDGGGSWQKIYSNGDHSIYSVYFTNDTTGFACGDDLLLLKTTDGGLTWNAFHYPELPINRFIVPLRDISFTDPNNGFVQGGDTYENGIVLRTYTAGASWIYTGFNNELRSSYFTDKDHGIVSGYGGMFMTSDSGTSFSQLNVSGDFFISLYFLNPTEGFAAGHNGGLYRTSDSGDSWKMVFDGNKALKKKMHFNAIRFLSNGVGYACGNKGLLMQSTDGGSTWKEVKRFTEEDLLCICPNGLGWLLAGSSGGRIYRIDI